MQVFNGYSAPWAISPGSEVLSHFISEMRRLTLQLSTLLNASVTFTSGSDKFRISDDTDCSCCNDHSKQSDCETASSEKPNVSSIDVIYEDRLLGIVNICSYDDNQNAARIGHYLVETALRMISLERQEEALLEELAASWESLGAVYEISSGLKSIHNPAEILDTIMDRAVSIDSGLKAGLWIDRSGLLEAVVTRNTLLEGQRDSSKGLLGKAVLSGQSIVINDNSRMRDFSATEPELALAQCVIITPIATRLTVIGALEIWHENKKFDFDSRTLRFVEALALQLAMVIENERLYNEYIQGERLRQDIEIGSRIQQTLLLGKPPDNISGLQITSLAIPSQRIDGDFYDFLRHSDHCIDILIGDVMGKGVPAALFGAATKSQFVRAARNIVSSTGDIRLPVPAEIVAEVHKEVVDQFIEFNSFVTLCYARFDTASRRMDFVDCGHTRTVHYKRDENICRLLEGENLPIGFSTSEVYKQTSAEFGEGDIFLFYSDGVTETRSEIKEMFGESCLAEFVGTNRDYDPEELLRALHKELIAFSASETFSDDLTCLVVKITYDKTLHHPLSEAASDLTIESDLNELGRVRDFASRACGELLSSAISEDHIFQIKLALTEAVTNIIRHSYRKKPGEKIQLNASAEGDNLIFQLSHTGESFDPASVAPPAFDGSRDGGFGLFIMSSVMDEIEYSRTEDGRNFITLSKKMQEDI